MKLKQLTNTAFVLPSIIITSVFLTAIGVLVTELAVNNFKVAAEDRYVLNAQLAADAGLDAGIIELNLDNDWTGTGGEVELLNDGDIRVTYEVTTATTAFSRKDVTAIGRTYKPVTDTTPRVSRTFVVDASGIGPLDLGDFSIITGAGGLYLENSAKIVAGDVYVNGEIFMENTSQIGTTLKPVDVRAAHANCPVPPDASYPQVCAAGENGEPINLSNSATIYGEVQGTNQLDGTNMQDPGLVPGDPPVEPLPSHNRNAQKAAVSTTTTGAAASCDSNSGTRIFAANTKIEGDVTWAKKCEITLLGDLWITGDLTMTNTAKVIVDDSLGTTLPTMMVDGSNGANFRNSSSFEANSSGAGIQFITYYSTDTCSPDCTDVTGPPLEVSRDYTTIYMDQSFSAPESLLYARWTQLLIDNSGDIGALLGQTVRLRNSTTVTFGTSVVGGGGSGDEKTYIINSYRRVIN